MCKASGHEGPLYKCDFGNSTAAGFKLRFVTILSSHSSLKLYSSNCNPLISAEFQTKLNIFREMLRLGKSLPWPDALEALTGSRKMDAQPLLDYFQPLYDFLVEKNAENGDVIGWGESSRYQYSP